MEKPTSQSHSRAWGEAHTEAPFKGHLAEEQMCILKHPRSSVLEYLATAGPVVSFTASHVFSSWRSPHEGKGAKRTREDEAGYKTALRTQGQKGRNSPATELPGLMAHALNWRESSFPPLFKRVLRFIRTFHLYEQCTNGLWLTKNLLDLGAKRYLFSFIPPKS